MKHNKPQTNDREIRDKLLEFLLDMITLNELKYHIRKILIKRIY